MCTTYLGIAEEEVHEEEDDDEGRKHQVDDGHHPESLHEACHQLIATGFEVKEMRSLTETNKHHGITVCGKCGM